jgi:hypothetical protein
MVVSITLAEVSSEAGMRIKGIREGTNDVFVDQ